MKLIYREDPVYPGWAKQARIPGRVHLTMLIGHDGTVQEARVISGHPVFYKAALDAVKRWRHEPPTIYGEPVEVEMSVTLDFKPD